MAIIEQDDFETGLDLGGPMYQGLGNAPTLSQDFASNGVNSAKCFVDRLDPANYYRSELTFRRNIFDTPFGVAHWYSYRIFLPDDYLESTFWELLGNFHDFPDDWAHAHSFACLQIGTTNGNYTVSSFTDPTPIIPSSPNPKPIFPTSINGLNLGSWIPDRGKWTEWVWHFDWSFTPGVGTVEMWKDGVQLLSMLNEANCYNETKSPYMKVGIYRGWKQDDPGGSGGPFPDTISTRTVYIDQVKIGDINSSFEEMTGGAPPVEPPPVVPPAAGTSVIHVISDNTVAQNGPSDDLFPGSFSTQILQTAPDTPQDGTDRMSATKFAVGDHTNGLFRFDLSSLPSNVTIVQATLYLQARSSLGDPPGGYSVGVYRLLPGWLEPEATWNNFQITQPWQVAGALGVLDSAQIASDAQIVATGFDGTYFAWDVTADVSGTYIGTFANRGWMLQRDDAGQDEGFWRNFYSNDATNGLRPELYITYTTAEEGGAVIESVNSTGNIVLDKSVGNLIAGSNLENMSAAFLIDVKGKEVLTTSLTPL